MTLRLFLIALTGLLTACETTAFGPKAPDIVLDDEPFVEAVLVEEADIPPPVGLASIEEEPIIPRTFGPDISPEDMAEIDEVSPVRPHVAIEHANAEAAIQPHPDNFQNSIQVYPYARGALYQV